MVKVHTLQLKLDWNLIDSIGKLNRFDASWGTIEKREGASLKQLKSVATVRSVGASTRIEGSKLSNEQIDVLLENLDISQLEERDEQEVVGYFEVMDLMSSQHGDIDITEGNIKNLHNLLLSHRGEDEWHRGLYKQHSNSVEATLTDGTKQIIFETATPGAETEDAMINLIDWYQKEQEVDPLVRCAVFAYEFISIHPFQDGNGRLSRLLTILLLLKHGYKWIEFVSLEHEIESRKNEYYQVLKSCQSERPNEDISLWLNFLFGSLANIQGQLMDKLTSTGAKASLNSKEKSVLTLIENSSGISTGKISKKLGIPIPTLKRTLSKLVKMNQIEAQGVGRGTFYLAV
jgi:Fic family protein